jgi:hypothetical protein
MALQKRKITAEQKKEGEHKIFFLLVFSAFSAPLR